MSLSIDLIDRQRDDGYVRLSKSLYCCGLGWGSRRAMREMFLLLLLNEHFVWYCSFPYSPNNNIFPLGVNRLTTIIVKTRLPLVVLF